MKQQLKLFNKKYLGRSEHGGDTRQGMRKDRRPLDFSRPVHLVLKSSRARGACSMLNPAYRGRVDNLVQKWAEKTRLKLYRYENVGNHLHLLIKAPDRNAFRKFLRTITGLIARLVTGARKGHKTSGGFWDGLAFSRVLHWGREFVTLKAYLAKNRLEAWGFRGAKLRIRNGERWIIIGDEALLPQTAQPPN